MACGKHTVSTDSVVLLQLRRIRNTYRITGLICGRKSGGCISLAVFLSSAARRAHGSSAEHAMRDLIASNAPLRARRKSPWGKAVRTKHVRMAQNITPGIQGAANRGPAKAQRSGFGGERRSSGTTELLPRKAKRRMWSLRRRGASFSSIFRRAAKDRVPEGRKLSEE